MSDYLAMIANHLDREPECRCVDTDRGTDTFGCDVHATRPQEPPAANGRAGEREMGQ